METTLCHIINGNKVLLKMAARGVSKGKWNGLGGKIDNGESPKQSAIREVREESGLVVKDMRERGTLYFYKGSRDILFVKMHLFSATKFDGKLTESDEGKLKWFNLDKLPYDEMWDDDRFWWPLMFDGLKFEGEFVFDQEMNRVVSYSISKIER